MAALASDPAWPGNDRSRTDTTTRIDELEHRVNENTRRIGSLESRVGALETFAEENGVALEMVKARFYGAWKGRFSGGGRYELDIGEEGVTFRYKERYWHEGKGKEVVIDEVRTEIPLRHESGAICMDNTAWLYCFEHVGSGWLNSSSNKVRVKACRHQGGGCLTSTAKRVRSTWLPAVKRPSDYDADKDAK